MRPERSRATHSDVSFFIHPAEARRQFTELAAGEITNADLARGALLIALEEYPRLDIAACLSQIDDLADRAARRGNAGDPPVFRLGHLQAEMFDVDAYRGDEGNYYDVRNAYLNEVIDRRIGLPITLSIIFIHAALRLGLVAHGLGLPGHYIVKVQFDLNEVYVDPFHGGTTLTLAEISELLSGMSAGQMRLRQEHLRAWSARETLARVLANLQSMYARAGEMRKSAAARERLDLLRVM
jgi:regulator of sirC expression with transglutaminase-like and TPR domain